MDFLRKAPQVSWPAAALTIFIAIYLSATLTVQYIEGMMADILLKTGFVFLSVIVYMTIVFVLSRLLKRMDIVDAAWGGGFIVAALTSFFVNDQGLMFGCNAQTLVTGLVVLWGARLAYFIIRRLLKHPEDKRYVELRNSWKGNVAVNSYARIFLTQGLLATIISIAVIHINISAPENLGYFTLVGLAIWLIGFFFEAVGDAQLKKHIADPKNKGALMTSGLWKYTRHPNYFGEATMWWGIFVIVLGTPYGWVGIITPVLITYLLVFVSGVKMSEKRFEGRKGWAAYKAKTSMFLPLLPKK
jgi:steroid 5-alpha reductase family enzyme